MAKVMDSEDNTQPNKSAFELAVEKAVAYEHYEKIRHIAVLVNGKLNLDPGDEGYISDEDVLDLVDIEYKREMLMLYRMYCASSDREVWADIVRVRVFDDIPSWFTDTYSGRVIPVAVENVTGILGITDHPWY